LGSRAAAARRALSIAVVQGGPSAEAEVSRASAANVARALLSLGHRVVRLELDAFIAESLRTGGYDVVFPVAHGAVGEDGSLQGVLEVLELPYVGSDVLASALAMHKRVARVLLRDAGVPVAKGIVLRRGECADARTAADRARREVGARLVVKPSAQGSAIGVERLGEGVPVAELARAIEAVWAIDEFALVEHFARGREVTCAVLGPIGPIGAGAPIDKPKAAPIDKPKAAPIDKPQTAPTALPLIEILSPRDPFYSFEARYAPGRSVHVCPAAFPEALSEKVQRIALEAHIALGCRDLSRVDFVVGDDGAPEAITLLEVNTIPGMTATSLYPEAAAAAGFPMPALCDALVNAAFERGSAARVAARPLPR
jgi:D-alanine-D-alanine ligase